MNLNMTKILIADSHFLVREGLKTILSSNYGFEVIAETEHYEKVMDLIEEKKPQIVIIGMNIHGVHAVDLIKSITHEHPDVKVLVLDTNEEVGQIIRILESGVHGYILKQCDHSEIYDAVRAIMQGKRFFCPNVLKLNANNTQNTNGDPKLNNNARKLSEREHEILSLISEGLTNNEIADRIFISAHTVASHRKNLMRKFQARNNVDLVISAIKENQIIP